MIKINYPKDIKILKKFENKFFTNIKCDIEEVNKLLSSVKHNGETLNLKKVILSPFAELIIINELIKEKHDNKLDTFFNYKKNQANIAAFFMQQKEVDIKVCYYCGINYINAFKDIGDFASILDFVNDEDTNETELKKLKGIDKAEAKAIYLGKPYIKTNDFPITENAIKNIVADFDNSKNNYNHFTIDHFFPQSKYKYLSLSLYNFVPSCYSCNTKFKKAHLFDENNAVYLSPTSNSFAVDENYNFKIYYQNLKDINLEGDFQLQHDKIEHEYIKEYIKVFKLKGRFIAHKDEILDIIKNKVKHSNSNLNELSEILGLSQKELKKMIFDKELFEKNINNKPLLKLKQDIAKQLKII